LDRSAGREARRSESKSYELLATRLCIETTRVRAYPVPKSAIASAPDASAIASV
jgi:hypothetical protein